MILLHLSGGFRDRSHLHNCDTAYFNDMVAYLDKTIGKIVRKLKEKNLFENTLLIFTGDNGTNVSVVTPTLI